MHQNNYELNLVPGGPPLIIHISQYDVGTRTFHFTLITDPGTVTVFSGATATLEATKPDGKAVIQECTYNADGTIDYTVQEQLAAKPGKVWSKIVLRNGGDVISSVAIVWLVDKAGVTDDAILSDSDITGMQGYIDQLAALVSNPVPVTTAASMTDKSQIYVYEGSESGYTNGNWYFWNGTAWISGGVYGGSDVEVDPTLSKEGEAADAKATGDAVNDLKSALAEIQNVSDINLLNGVTWELGSINKNDGLNLDGTTRIRTIGFIDLQAINILKFAIDSGYKFVVDWYNPDKTKNGASPFGVWQTSNLTINVPEGVAYMRLLVATTSDGTASTDFAQYLTVEGTNNFIDAIDAIDKLKGNVANEFSTTADYNIGDYVIYDNSLYKFTEYHVAGAWRGSDAQKVNISNELGRFYMSFAKGIEKISLISGYNINTNGVYQTAQYTTYCMDPMSYFKVADGATSIGISGGKGLYVRFYDEELKALGNGGQTTAANFTVQVNSADNPALAKDAKWVKFGGQANFNGINFINLEPGRFIPVDERIDSVYNYRTIIQTDMAEGYIIYSAGGRAANADYVYIEGVPVIPKQKVYMTAYFGGGATNSGGISGYDENGDFKCRVFDGPINGNPDTSRTQYINKEIIIPDGVYYIAFSTRKDGTAPIKLSLGTVFDPTTIVNEAIKKHEIIDGDGTVFDAEAQASIEALQTVLASSGKPMLTMAVFTDLHHDPKYPNDPTNDMFANIKAINDRIHVDALMNLGDAIDGQFQTQFVAEELLADVVTRMYDITDRSHNLTGNHDDNVQSTWESRGNLPASERMTLLELNDVLFKGSTREVHNENHLSDYYIDYDEYGIRVICIGMDYTTYVQATQTWLENVALDTDKAVLVFSHCATKAKWGYENDVVNGSYIETPLNAFVQNGGTVIALVHGHTHGDMIETDSDISFTEVAIGCAKFSTPTSGTQGITYQDRSADDYTKILFDIVCIDQTNSKVHFIRCGAGTDRYISY